MSKEKANVVYYDDGDFVINFKPRSKTQVKKKARVTSINGGHNNIVDNERYINYDKLLDQWFELVMKESDKARQLSDEEYYKKPYSFKQGHLKGYANGLIMATSILNNLERKVKRKINNK